MIYSPIPSLILTIDFMCFPLTCSHSPFLHPAAFSFFAFCEYLIASANMGFHWTCTLDFPTEDFLIANGTDGIRQLYADQFKCKETEDTNGGSVNREEGQQSGATTVKKDL